MPQEKHGQKKKVFKNPPCDFALTFILNVLNLQNNPFALRTHIRHKASESLVWFCCMCPCFLLSSLLLPLSLFLLEPP